MGVGVLRGECVRTSVVDCGWFFSFPFSFDDLWVSVNDFDLVEFMQVEADLSFLVRGYSVGVFCADHFGVGSRVA